MPTISIIIPCYNHGKYLQEAIDSVEQYPDTSVYEIIIVDDGSNDAHTIALFKRLENKGYNIIHQENKGLSNARNTGIKAAKGNYILPLDSDNKIKADYIKKSIKILDKDNRIGVVYSNLLRFGERNEVVENLDFNIERLIIANYIDACAVFRKKVWEEVNGFDENKIMRLGLEDWDFWLRVSNIGWTFHYIKEVLFEYRVRKDSMLRTTTKDHYQKIVNYIFSKSSNSSLAIIKSSNRHIKNLEEQIKGLEEQIKDLKGQNNLKQRQLNQYNSLKHLLDKMLYLIKKKIFTDH